MSSSRSREIPRSRHWVALAAGVLAAVAGTTILVAAPASSDDVTAVECGPDTVTPDRAVLPGPDGHSVNDGAATFVVPDDACLQLTFASYALPGGFVLPYEDQVLYEAASSFFGPGRHDLSVALPPCSWQTDLYYGSVLEQIPPEGHEPTRDLVGEPGWDGLGAAWDLSEGAPCEPIARLGDLDCANGGYGVVLDNSAGATTAVFVIETHSDVGVTREEVPVEAFSTGSTVAPVPEDGTASITVTVDGKVLLDASVQRDCEQPTPVPDVAVVPDCAEGGAVLRLTNTGDADITVTVTADGSPITTDVLVPAGTTSDDPIVVTHPMSEDQTVVFRATGPGYDSGDRPFTLDCDEPAPAPEVAIDADCSAGGAVLRLTNTGDADITVTVTADGSPIATDVLVPPGTTSDDPVVVTHPMSEDQTVVFRATGPGYDSGDRPFTIDCLTEALPVVSLRDPCVAIGVAFQFTNLGGVDATVTMSRSGTAIDTFTVPAGTTAANPLVRSYPMAEDSSAVYRATTPDGFDSGDLRVVRNCVNPPTEVLGTRITRPAALAATGAEVRPWLALGLGLIGLGVMLVAAAALGPASRRSHLV